MALTGCGEDDAAPASQSATSNASADQPAFSYTGSINSEELKTTGREQYPDLAFIDMEQLKEEFLDYTLVDIRSNFEFRTIRMLDAVSIPANDDAFAARIRNLTRKHKPPIVFYGNGGNDRTVHETARLAVKELIENVYVYDGRIQDWARDLPELAQLNGQNIDQENVLIDDYQFSQKQLNDDQFRSGVTSENGVLLDVRDSSDDNRHPLQNIAIANPLDHRDNLATLIAKVKADDRPLYVFDDYGQKTRWLMYYLQQQGIENFYFLENGLLN